MDILLVCTLVSSSVLLFIELIKVFRKIHIKHCNSACCLFTFDNETSDTIETPEQKKHKK